MGISDGFVLGRTKLVDHGPASQRYNIVFIGDGYTASEMAQFATDVDNSVAQMRATSPFDELWCGINVYRIDVVSLESGADDPATCADGTTGSGAAPRTYFDASYCNYGVRRALVVDNAVVKSVVQAQVPEAHFMLCIVNSTISGGTGGEVATMNRTSTHIATHEMGHTAFGLLDEYEYFRGCGSGETDHNNHPAVEPSARNVTINTDPATIKWAAHLTNAADGLPTTNNADCSACDTQSNPRGFTYVGAYEGASHYHCGVYRPFFNCTMRSGFMSIFCPVCQHAMRQTLAPFLPPESLTLVTPSIAFTDIPQGVGGAGATTWRAVVFEVVTCGSRTLRITAGPTGGFGTPLGTTDLVGEADADPVAEARIWLSYTSTTPGATATGSVTIACDQTGESWDIPIVANTVARKKAAIALVVDHSGSMSEDAGGGTTKVGKLREAANIFVAAMLDGDALGIARFDDTAEIVLPLTPVGPPVIGAGRAAAIGIINGPKLDPDGMTGIGAGILAGKEVVDTALWWAEAAQEAGLPPPIDVLGMVVLTDGVENTPPMIADVASSLTANTFAIGIGRPQNISVAGLNALTLGHDGYLLVTGGLDSSHAARLNKYILQILAGIGNADVLLDPGGLAAPGTELRIPFQVSETDMGIDVFLLSPLRRLRGFALETPDGTVVDALDGPLAPNLVFVPGLQMSYYRLPLPALPGNGDGSHSGTWHALLSFNPGGAPAPGSIHNPGAAPFWIPYDLVVHSHSNLQLRARAEQSSFEPGATVQLHASLREYDTPVHGRARMWAEVVRPDGSRFDLPMPEVDPGRFEAAITAKATGLYTLRMRATGATYAGSPFQREQTATAAVFPGGDQPANPAGGSGDAICSLLSCFLRSGVVDDRAIERLRARGFDLKAAIGCLERLCRHKNPPGVERRSARAGAPGNEGEVPELLRRLREALLATPSPPRN